MILRRAFSLIVLLVLLFTAACGAGSSTTPPPVPTRPVKPSRTSPPRHVSPTPKATAPAQATDTPSPAPSPTPVPPTATASPTAPEFTGPYRKGERSLREDGPIYRIQTWLTTLGYTEVGEIDGIFGSKTEAAVKHFQQDHDLPDTGVVDEATWTALYQAYVQMAASFTPTPQASSESGAVFTRNLQLGAQGDDVVRLHDRLEELGYPLCLYRDNARKMFNEQTAGAVRLFQRLNGLAVDGVVGPKTSAVMFSNDAVPFTFPEPAFTASTVGQVDGGGDLAYSNNTLWLARGSTVEKINPGTGEVVKIITVPDLPVNYVGEFGQEHAIGMRAFAVQPVGQTLWLGGGAKFEYGLYAPVARRFSMGGSPKGAPVYFYNTAEGLHALSYTDGYVTDIVLGDDNTLWAVVNQYGEYALHLYRLSAGGEVQAHFYLNLLSTQLGKRPGKIYDLAYSDNRLWAAVVEWEGSFLTLMPISTAYGVAGDALGVCGLPITYDGQWLWIGYDKDVLLAVNPATGDVEASARIDGNATLLASDGKGRVWVVTTNDRKHYTLQFFSTH